MKISIVTVCFNSEKTIRRTLSSLMGQSYSPLEYIVIDGGSTDETLSHIKNCSTELDLKYVSEPDGGIFDAMNKGVQCATGDVIGILNSDDFYAHSNVLNEVATAFATDSSLDVVLGDVDFVSGRDLTKPLRTVRATGFKPWMFRFGFVPPHPGVFVRKSTYERVGLYKPGYKIASDFDFLVRLLFVDQAKYHATGQHWVRMRVGGTSTASWRSNLIITHEMLKSLRENGVGSNIVMLLARLPLKFLSQRLR